MSLDLPKLSDHQVNDLVKEFFFNLVKYGKIQESQLTRQELTDYKIWKIEIDKKD